MTAPDGENFLSFHGLSLWERIMLKLSPAKQRKEISTRKMEVPRLPKELLVDKIATVLLCVVIVAASIARRKRVD
jgi:hypothetical protein